MVAASAAVFAAAGSLDPSFGTGGVVTIVPTVFGGASTVLAQADGKVVVAGYEEGLAGSAHPWRIRRLLTDGTADTGFGSSGQVTLFGTNTGANDQVWALAQDGNGRILAGGNSHKYVTIGTTTVSANLATIVRLNDDGSLDATFGTAGVVGLIVPGMWNATSLGRGIALQPDGNIIFAGWGERTTKKAPNGYQRARFAARLSGSGAIDTSFGTGGFAIDDVSTGADILYPGACALQSDGKILLGGSAGTSSGNQPWAITRLLGNGAADTSFGTLWISNGANRLAVDASDRILVVGSANSDAVVHRYTSNGAIDSSFGTGGTAAIHDAANATSGAAVAALPDGRIAVAIGRANTAYVARLLTTGAMDPAFGAGGIGDGVSIDQVMSQSGAISVAPDGGLLTCGFAFHTQVGGNIKNWWVARNLGN